MSSSDSKHLELLARKIRARAELLFRDAEGMPVLPPSQDATASAQRLLFLVNSLRQGRNARTLGLVDQADGGETPHGGFDEELYLLVNPDVMEAVASGGCLSGYDHWIRHGKAEFRGGGPTKALTDRRPSLSELRRRSFGVNLYGFHRASSGLGEVARGLARACASARILTTEIDIAPWNTQFEARTLPGFTPSRVNVILQNADMMDRFFSSYGTALLQGSYNIAFWFWELPAMRADWFSAYAYADEIWVGSEFCRNAVQSLTALPVVKIPPVVDGLESKIKFGRKHFGLPEDKFVFFFAFDMASQFERKNPLALIEAFRNAFGDRSDVLLCLKYSNGAHNQEAMRLLDESIQGATNIVRFDAIVSDEEILSLHNSADCFVSPHRSEGFGLNVAQAMYLGKPVIATAYSSVTDFMTPDNSYPLDYRLTTIREQSGPYRKHGVWAEPSRDHLTALLRRVFENADERAMKGKAAARDIRSQFGAEQVGRLIRNRLEELDLHQEIPSERVFRGPSVQAPPLLSSAPAEIRPAIRQLSRKPIISIVTPVYNVQAALLRRCIESVKAQWYPFWELCLCDDTSTDKGTLEVLREYRGSDVRIRIVRNEQNLGIAGASNRAAEISTGEFLAMLDNDDEITPDALYEVVKALNGDSAIDLLYTDEDKLEETGEFTEPYFKPDWSPEHLHSVMYMLHMLVIRKELFYDAGEFRSEFSGAQDYDLALRASTLARTIHHVPKVLYHWRKIAGSAAAQVDAKPQALEAGRRALEDHIQKTRPGARVESGKLTGHFRVRYSLAHSPLASLCITTNDTTAMIGGRGKINLLENFVKSIRARTDYSNYEVVICDNGNLSKRTQRALQGIPYRLVSYGGSQRPFNFADKANFVFSRARGDHIVLLNDDLEVISSEWLTSLLELSAQPAIGVAGARLLFPDNKIQHVGMILGINGGAAHVYQNYPADFIGYNGFTHIIRNYSAVTGACMAMRRAVLEELGGFDNRFTIDYNDVDFCLRAVEKGYRVVYTPYAELYHFEGRTEKRNAASAETTRIFQERWSKYLSYDPHYNPNLTRDGVDFAPSSTRPALNQAATA